MINIIKNYFIEKQYIKIGLKFAKRHQEVSNFIHLGLDISYDKKLSKLEKNEKIYANSGFYEKGTPYQTIDFITLADEFGDELEQKNIEPFLRKPTTFPTYHAKKHRENINKFYEEQRKNIQIIKLSDDHSHLEKSSEEFNKKYS